MSLLFIFLMALLHTEAIGLNSGKIQTTTSTSRLVVTFYTAADNNQNHNLPHNYTLIKQYGRRLVLDLGHPFELDTERSFLQAELRSVQSVEFDSLTVAQYDDRVYSTHNLDTTSQPTLWNLLDSEPYSIHAQGVWPITNSTPDIVVAIIDSGIANVAQSMFLNLLDGYDFISDESISLDKDGRDPDAADPGDWCPTPSWHGTKVASILAARHDNEWGMKGVAQNCSVLPLRVLGQCGMGYATDVTDAIVWAAGGLINGVDSNPRPSRIISLSLAGKGECPGYLQTAVSQAISLGTIVVSAAGNNNEDTRGYFPANCRGVVTVAASTRKGKPAHYSNWGSNVALYAPGGENKMDPIMALSVNEGGVGVAFVAGTSFAVPHVVGVIAVNIHHNEMHKDAFIYFYYTYFYNDVSDDSRGRIISMGKTFSKDLFTNSLYSQTGTVFSDSQWKPYGDKVYSSETTTMTTSNNDDSYPCTEFTSNLMFIADQNNNKIKKVSLIDGYITTVAGNGTAAFVDGGTGISRLGSRTFSLHISQINSSVMFVSEQNCVRLLSLSSYILTTISGNCLLPGDPYTGITSAFLSLDNQVLYLTDGNTIKSLNLSSREVKTLAGSSANAGGCINGPATTALFDNPISVVQKDNILLIVSTASHTIQSLNLSTMNVSIFAGNCGLNSGGQRDGVGTSASFQSPMKLVSYRNSNNSLFLIDFFEGKMFLRKISYPGAQVSTITSILLPLFYSYFFPFDGSFLYFQDTMFRGIAKYNLSSMEYSFFAAGSSRDRDGGLNEAGVGDRIDIAIYQCQGCILGQYSKNNTCISCPQGKYASVFSGTTEAICLSCNTRGTYSLAGYSACEKCPFGTYAKSQYENSKCEECSSGFYSTVLGSTTALDCQPCLMLGTYADKKASTCSLCSPGFYSNVPLVQECPYLCFSGYYSTTIGSTTKADCIGCSILGTYAYPGSSTCSLCSTGTYSQTVYAGYCSYCPSGYYSTTIGSTTKADCIGCSILGTYTYSGSSTCLLCSTGTYSDKAYAGYCSYCPSGYYSTMIGSTTQADCIGCSILGTYTYSGSSTCLLCYAGTYGITPGSCIGCKAGTYSAAVGATAISTCIECSAMGSFSGPSFTRCHTCTPGGYVASITGPYCQGCVPGNYASMAGASACLPCDVGKYADFHWGSYCTQCSGGKFSQTLGANTVNVCVSCKPGAYASELGSSICKLCSQGYYSTYSAAPICQSCNVGGYSTASGASSSNACSSCAPGTFASSMASTICSKCTAGTFVPSVGSSSCSNCWRGYYSNGSGAFDCSGCTAGTFTSFAGASTCQNCVLGTYNSFPLYATMCGSCTPGKYASSQGGSTCQQCPAGSFASASGYYVCDTCASGAYCPSGSIVPTNCSAGTYSSMSGAVTLDTCLSCPAGKYCPSGTAVPNNCSNGTFSDSRSMICTTCPQFSSSGVGSTVCQCNAGYFETGKGGSVAFGLSYLGSLYGDKWVSYPPYITISGSMDIRIAQGSTITFTLQPFMGVSCGLQLFSDLFNVEQESVSESSIISGMTLTFLEHISVTSSYAQSQSFLYSTGVTGQNTASLVWDTSEVPSGLYYLLPTIGSPKRYAISVFVASLTPVTLTYNLNASSIPFVTQENPVAACMGDTIVLNKISSIQSAASIAILCFPRGQIQNSDIMYKIYGTAPVSWTVDSGSGDSQCVIGMDVYGIGLRLAAVLTVYARPTGSTATPASWSDLACASCPAGYRYSKGSSNCTECGLGYYSAGAADTCLECPLGTSCPFANTSAPVDCGVGAYSSGIGATACLGCSSGVFSSVEGSSSCLACGKCLVGQYIQSTCSPSTDVICSQCSHLPADAQYTGVGSDETTCPWICIEGYFLDEEDICSPCPEFYWCIAGAKNECPTNTLSAMGSSSQNQCLCAPGYFGNGSRSGTSPCPICTAGSYCPGGNKDLILPCRPNFTSPSGSSSVEHCVCIPGYKFSINNNNSCELCLSNEICFKGLATACPGNSQAPTGSSLITDCVCSPGFAGPGPCTPCPSNYVCSGGGMMLPCTAHAVSPVQSINASACYCDRGYQGVENQTCTACPPNTWCWTGVLNECPSNTSSPALSNFIYNCTCDPGFTGSNGTACRPCQIGMFNVHGGNANCSYCPPGWVSPTASSACSQCPPGTFAMGQTSACSVCQHGSFSKGGATACTNCSVCKIGQYNVSNCNATANVVCAACAVTIRSDHAPRLTFTNAGINGPLSCPWHCSGGYLYHNLGCWSCFRNVWCLFNNSYGCPANSGHPYGFISSQSTCMCNSGYFGVGGWSSRIPLLPGQLEPPANWSGINCEACPRGKYSTGTVCLSCMPGTYSSVLAASSAGTCTACSAGTFSLMYAADNASACLPCPMGTFSNATGATRCHTCKTCQNITLTPCEAGSTIDSVACKCHPGYYGSFQCTPCPPNTNTTQSNDSLTLLDCICLPGYTCQYKKKIKVVIRVRNVTSSQFNLSNFISAVAQAAHVDVEQVSVVNVSEVVSSSSRRLLSLNHPHATTGKHADTRDYVLCLEVLGALQVNVDAVYRHLEDHAHLLSNTKRRVEEGSKMSHADILTFTLRRADFFIIWEPAHELRVSRQDGV